MNKKIAIIVTLALLAIVAFAIAYTYYSNNLESEEPSEKLDGTICTMEYMPVCGIDGITYGNKCMAGSMEIAYNGECVDENSLADGTYPVGEVPEGKTNEELAAV